MCVTILRPRSRSLVLASRRVLAVLAAMNARTTARTGVVVQLMVQWRWSIRRRAAGRHRKFSKRSTRNNSG